MDAHSFHGFQPMAHHGDGYLEPHLHRSVSAASVARQEHEQEVRNDLEAKKLVRKMPGYKYRSRTELRDTNPSIKDGLDPHKEVQWRRQYTKLIQESGIQLRIPQWGIGVGIVLCHRFFAAKSMKRNDRYLIATACLFLGAKIMENPRQLRTVIVEVEKVRNARNPAALKALEDQSHLERLREEVLQAERAVLYTLGFELNIDSPHKLLMEHFAKLGIADWATSPEYRPLVQNTWNLLNDSMRTTVTLQYAPSVVAAAVLWMADRLGRESGLAYDKVPQGSKFYAALAVKPEDCVSIVDQVLEEYESMRPVVRGSAPGDAPTDGADVKMVAGQGPPGLLGRGGGGGQAAAGGAGDRGPMKMEVDA